MLTPRDDRSSPRDDRSSPRDDRSSPRDDRSSTGQRVSLALTYLALAAVCLFGLACEEKDEWRARMAVKGLATAPEQQVPQQMKKVVSYGRLALVDIEQVIQDAEEPGRLRLLDALRNIGDPEAIPLVKIVARWDASPAVRKEAHATIMALEKRAP